jgi:Flp pilus assembly protein TadD
VAGVVLTSAGICLVAVLKLMVVRPARGASSQHAAGEHALAGAIASPPTVVLPQSAAVLPELPAATQHGSDVAAKAPSAAVMDDPAAENAGLAKGTVATSEGSASVSQGHDPLEARRQKQAAQRALERSDPAEAITFAELSVALDPTDAETWLILGAAYQQRGRASDARRCFTTCAKTATRGPRAECAALLR